MRVRWPAVLILFLTLAACDDDPSGPCDCPEESPWTEVELGIVLGDTAELSSIDCAGGDCVAAGLSFSGKRGDISPGFANLFYELAEDGGFVPRTFPGLAAENYADVALDQTGAVVIVGYGLEGSTSFYGAIYDARTPTPTAISQPGRVLLTVDGDGDFFVAGGVQSIGLLESSPSPGSWSTDVSPSSGKPDGGFRDVNVRGDVAVACGYDDGADTLQVIQRRTKTGSWKMLNRNGLPFAVELRCIALNDDGTIYVGGVQGPGGPNSQAWTSVRSPAGEWTTMSLPDPVELGRVNDILLATDGSIYLACSSEYRDTNTAHLLRVTGAGATPEIIPFGGSLLQLAEGGDGTIYAVGSRRIGDSVAREPVLLRRAP